MTDDPKPVAWMMANPTCPTLKRTLHWVAPTDWHITWEAHPLYDRATLDAAVAQAVAAERERIAVLVEWYPTNGDHVQGWFDLLAAAIRALGDKT